MSLADLVQRRLVLVTGKGGVGKTTLAASLGRAWAAKGKRVLCTEVVATPDTPSQLGVVLGAKRVTEEPSELFPNLSVALLTPTVGHLRFLQDTLPIKMLADAAMRSQGLRKFLSAAPGFSDMGVMYRLLDVLQMKLPDGVPRFDIVLVDTPATGHALALAQIPEFLTRAIPGGPIVRAAREGLQVMTNPSLSGAVVVTLAETLPVTEALELQRGLKKHRLPLAALVVNRVPENPFSVEERAAVETMLKNSQTVLGARELQRIERAEAALELLKQNNAGTWVTVKEVPETGAHVSERLASLM